MMGREGTGVSQEDPDVCVCVCVCGEEGGSEECGVKKGQENLWRTLNTA